MGAPITRSCILALTLLTPAAYAQQGPAGSTAAAAAAAAVATSAAAPAPPAPASTAAAPTPAAVPAPAADLPRFDPSRPEIRAYIREACAQGLARERIIAALTAAEPQPQIVDAMNRPAEKTMQWWEYRARMLTPGRIEAGAQLWREHKELLDQIAAEYQVPPEYLVAVLGVETLYGHITGHYRVIDALATLAFDYPPRERYFRRELTDFLLLAREQGFDPLSVRGSYAGAMGALQFMPSSYRKYAISEQPGLHSDLWGDWGDIFASTANFLHQSGWQYGAPVLAEVTGTRGDDVALSDHLGRTDTLGSLRAGGLSISTTLPDDTPALLLAAPEPDSPHYRVGFHNFYVITRYNSSPLYAMAVFDLAQAIRERIAVEAAL
ncbi:MAG TPA: lytic murein transglycosylase B [Steroidobacteraceae bacterium]|nr:lytic murein transglycosylase B [Steroidobacteraceae bacterium]